MSGGGASGAAVRAAGLGGAAARAPEVLLTNPAAWPEVRRGSERVLALLLPALTARGIRPRALVGGPGARPGGVRLGGARVRRVPRAMPARAARRGRDPDAAHVPALRLALAVGRRPDVVHALHPADAHAALTAGRGPRPPVVASIMGIPDRSWAVERRGRLTALTAALHESAAAVALSDAAAERLWRDFGARARVIAPPVDTDLLAPGGVRAPAPTVLCPADATVARKRVDLLVAAVGRLRARHDPRTRLVLSRPRDPVLAGRLAGAPGVELRDLDDDLVLRDAYREAWCTALLSEGEAFGLVLAESLACGTPVLAARAGALPEVVGDDAHGALVDVRGEAADAERVADALAGALERAHDPSVARACRARGETFAVAACADAYAALYREVLGATPAPVRAGRGTA